MTQSGPQSHFLPYKAGWWPSARGDNEGRWGLACEPSCSCLLGALVVDQRDFSGSFSSSFGCSGRQLCPNPAGILLLCGVPGTGVMRGDLPHPSRGVPPALSPPGRTAGPEATSWATGSDPAGPVLAPVTPAAFQALQLVAGQGREKHHPSPCDGEFPLLSRPSFSPEPDQHPAFISLAGTARDGLGQGPGRGTGMWHWGQRSDPGDRNMALWMGMWYWEWGSALRMGMWK